MYYKCSELSRAKMKLESIIEEIETLKNKSNTEVKIILEEIENDVNRIIRRIDSLMFYILRR